MSEQNKSNRGTVKIAGAAIVLVVVGVVAAVYVNGAGSGNTSDAVAGADSGPACSATVALAEAIQPFASGQVAAMASASEPKALTSLAFNNPDGEKMSLAALSGKTVLINLWATWCAPCREEMPALDELQAAMGSEDFEVVAINIDTGDDTKPKNFLNEIGVEHLGFYRDNTMGVFNDLKKQGLAFGLPVTLLVDEEGCLLANMNGPAHWSSDDAKTYIGKALEGVSETPSG
ncbi:thiol:disulfide interchange protein TlpA [Hoeflea poritis]|uniref:TlpA disulfide reductase family protein n=1 Tax=Hoeflea poritis TaxID=2993659 RepID=A0ABT4VMH3_9HYPH|nr:TlpA disulfide reductase family protein [Hoeflea poritis]MDA4845814.1 TlpA disulfide reductase family protein [Hoeflea poritis]